MEKYLKIKQSALEEIRSAVDLDSLRSAETKYLGRKAGEITELMKGLKDLPNNEKKEAGMLLNDIKKAIESAIIEKSESLSLSGLSASLEAEKIDVTAPAIPREERGHFHPLTVIGRDLEEFFASMGFVIVDGPELESEYYNFTALNIPADHPARDMQDTFYIKNHPGWLMRTHTSPLQIRSMQKYGVPLRAVMMGTCYRNESTDPRHEHTLHQMEGLVIDENITLADLKGLLEAVAKHLYGPETKVRLRPKFYPFVEPGINGEVTCALCNGTGCRVCKNTGWIEIFGAGMVHPNVLKEGGINPEKYQGFAFGFGMDRLAMMKYNIDDVRLFASGDLRFVKQF